MRKASLFLVLALLFTVGAASAAEIKLPPGFHIQTMGQDLGSTRHIAVAPNGDIYISIRRPGRNAQGAILAVRDADGDGKPEQMHYFGRNYGTGIAVHDGYLYHQGGDDIERWRLPKEGALVPEGDPELVVSHFSPQGEHEAKAIAFDDDGHMYVSIGAPSNSCQEENRSRGSRGIQPCPQLETNAGIWRFPAGKIGLTFGEGERFATGLRHCVAMTWDNTSKSVWVAMHGRDQLNMFPDYYSDKQSSELPAEELHQLTQGLDAGWPYTYWDPARKQRMLAPEYGGNGATPVKAGMFADPEMAFPAHWAPNTMAFYSGTAFPQHYQKGLFVGFHGSWNRAPYEQGGYVILFVPFGPNGQISGDYETFANGFAGTDKLMNPGSAEHRVCGVAVAPDGGLYVVDDKAGYLWKISYQAL